MRAWRLFAIGCLLVLAGSLLAWRVQTASGVEVRDVRFQGASGTTMSGLLYLPRNATPQTPAPGVLAVHGYINTRETQSGFAIEFARRGYVVLAMDQTGHGYSGGAAFSNGFGGPDGLAYLRGLDIVDPANVGLEGHSMGGWTVLAAAAAQRDGYKAMVLQGSSTGPPFAAPGTPTWPRNLALVFSRYDEFSKTMWGVDRAVDAPSSPKLKTLFAATADVEPGRIYGSIEAGTARVLHTPPVTHPGDHLSTRAIGHSTDWFARTLAGGTPRPASDQIWWWKELGTGIALVGVLVLILGAFDGLLRTPLFAKLHQPVAADEPRGPGGGRGTLLLTAFLPVLTFFPAFILAGLVLPPSPILPQGITNQVLAWAVVNAVLSLGIGLMSKRAAPRFANRWVLSALLAAAVVAIGYVALFLADRLLQVDFRFWVVALKLPSADQLRISLVYVIPFTLAFALSLRSLLANVVAPRGAARSAYTAGIAAMSLGFLVMLAVIYGVLFATGTLLTAFDPLSTVVAIQFLPLTAAIGLIAAFTYRRTRSYAPAAILCGLLVTLYVVAGTATQVV
jgi:pimeloyl-ACP methyl ester carboxylesterase